MAWRQLEISRCETHPCCVALKDGVSTTHYTDVARVTIDFFSLASTTAQSETVAQTPDPSSLSEGTGVAATSEGGSLKDTAPALAQPGRIRPTDQYSFGGIVVDDTVAWSAR